MDTVIFIILVVLVLAAAVFGILMDRGGIGGKKKNGGDKDAQ